MNLKSFLNVTIVALILSACGGQQSNKSEETATEQKEVSTYAVDTQSSKVMWSGEVAGVYGHNGLINIAEGSVTTDGETVSGGTVVIDMTTIQPTDSASYKDEDGRRASDLVGHLSTGDFFLVDSYPTSTFKIKSQQGNLLVGDLTIRGITKEEKATLNAISVENGTLTASATLVFNRQDYEVSWVHFMKDMILSDAITIDIELVGKK